MRNVAMLAATVCLCACLLGGAGCNGWEWPPGSRNDQPGPDDQPAFAQETPEQKTIRTQGETIDALQVENEQLKDDIVELANAIVRFQEDIEGLEFALEQRSAQQLHAGELADENRRLEERMQVLEGENKELQTLLDELHEKYERLLDAVSGDLSDDEDEGDDADADDDADDDADEDRSRIHFND